jgi:hypothetical protein
MKKQPWFEYPNFISFQGKGMKVMCPRDGQIYEIFLRGYFPYDHYHNDGLMGVFEGEEDEYVNIEWSSTGVTIKFLDRENFVESYQWDRIYPIPLLTKE